MTPAIELFDLTEERKFFYESPATEDTVTNRFLSMSFMAAMRDVTLKEKLVDDVQNLVRKGEGMVWIDKESGLFEYPYETLAFVARKK